MFGRVDVDTALALSEFWRLAQLINPVRPDEKFEKTTHLGEGQDGSEGSSVDFNFFKTGGILTFIQPDGSPIAVVGWEQAQAAWNA